MSSIALLVILLLQEGSPSPALEFQFSKGQHVYVVAVETSSRDISLTKANLFIERKVKSKFKKLRVYTVSNTLRNADFVFFVMLDATSSVADELALVLLPNDYVQFSHNLDSLRGVAIWQSADHHKSGRNTALRLTTLGLSRIFHHPSVSQELVKRFHKEVIPKKIIVQIGLG